MAQTDVLKRYIDAAVAFTQMTRTRAEDVVKELVKAGELQRDQVQAQVDDLIERSRRSTERLVEVVRTEVSAQFSELGLATRDDLQSLEQRVREWFGSGSRPGPAAP